MELHRGHLQAVAGIVGHLLENTSGTSREFAVALTSVPGSVTMHCWLHGERLLSQLTVHMLRVPEHATAFSHLCVNNQLLF